MDGQRFDAMTETLGQRRDRRGVLRLLAGAGAAAVGVRGGSDALGRSRPRATRQKKKGGGYQLECELLGGTWRGTSSGGGTCRYKFGYYVICDRYGQCIRVCRVSEGCDCDDYDEPGSLNFCDESLVHSPAQGNPTPIGGAFTR